MGNFIKSNRYRMIEHVFLYIISFLVFIFLQSLMINGVYEAFKGSCWEDMKEGRKCSGNIFYKISPSFFEKHREKNWTLNLWGCVKCMSSIYSILTFFPLVIYLFGFHWVEIYVWVVDAFSLITLNYWIYKKL